MKQLIFVYNANSGLFNSLNDFAHKMLSPSTYACALCKLTYGNFTMKKEWQTFISKLPCEVVFLYKDTFQQQYDFDAKPPVVFVKDGTTLNVLVTKQQLENCSSLQELEKLVTTQLALHG